MEAIRTCIICKLKKNKKELFRLVDIENNMVYDENQKINARGFYICNNNKCIDRLLKHKKLMLKYNTSNVKEIIKKIGGIGYE